MLEAIAFDSKRSWRWRRQDFFRIKEPAQDRGKRPRRAL